MLVGEGYLRVEYESILSLKLPKDKALKLIWTPDKVYDTLLCDDNSGSDTETVDKWFTTFSG